MTEDRPEFSVYQFFENEREDAPYERVREWVRSEEAWDAALHYCTSVAVKMGWVHRVIITDGGDECCFEWKRSVGVTYPRKEDLNPGVWERMQKVLNAYQGAQP